MSAPRTTAPLALLALLLLPAAAAGAPWPGDLDGDGDVDAEDEARLAALYGLSAADAAWEPAGDLDASGRIDHLDLGRFGAGFGATGGEPDVVPPTVRVTFDEIPDDMDDLLVVPPDGFRLTVLVDGGGGSMIDIASLSVTADGELGGASAGSELAGFFSVTPTRAAWIVPPGTAIANYEVTASVRDAAGNEGIASYAFAVRPFAYGPPLAQTQLVHLDFDQDRGLGTFTGDLREFGLSSAAAPAVEQAMRERLVAEIVARALAYYGRLPDGSPGPDAVDLLFTAVAPAEPHARLCVGGRSSLGAGYLGAAPLDVHNLKRAEDTCTGTSYGVFPSALDNRWGSDPEFLAVFAPLDPGLGGVPVGADPLDAAVTAPDFDPATATPEAAARWAVIENAVDAFAQAIATVVAHETGHLLGLVAHGPTPAGLYGGDASTGGNLDHNVRPTGGTPTENWLMNAGGSFTFQEATGRGGQPLPRFRALAWAYLRNRIALNTAVTGLYPPPEIHAVTPNPVAYGSGQNATITIHGAHFQPTPFVELISPLYPTPRHVWSESLVDGATLTGAINKFVVLPGSGPFDVRVVNPDGQEAILENGLEVQ